METIDAPHLTLERTRRRSPRASAISALGPTAATAGILWAILQPYRVTLLHPAGQSFWWLVIEPPLLVVVAGIVFAVLVARPLLADLERHALERRGAPEVPRAASR